MEYLDFVLKIGGEKGPDYSVEVIQSPAGQANKKMCLEFDDTLKKRLQDLKDALLRSCTVRRKVEPEDEKTIQVFGKYLFEALIGGEIRSCFDSSRNVALSQGKGLRIQLRLQSPALTALPWEFLYDEKLRDYLCLSGKTPTIRYLEINQSLQRLKVTPPLRILAMIASPKDLPKLKVEEERKHIEDAVKDLKGALEITWVKGQTVGDLQDYVGNPSCPWHVFHFIGHGGYDYVADEGAIALADEEGLTDLITATAMARLLGGAPNLRLVFLNACEGAKGSKIDIDSSTAARLVSRGVPAVVAMQYEISDTAAIKFSQTFYRLLARGAPIDAAVDQARIAISVKLKNSLEWGTPVLYMLSPDGVLFEIDSTVPMSPEPPLPVETEITAAPAPQKPTPPEIKKGWLRVDLEPKDSTVKFLDIQAEFAQGMELAPGNYNLEISAAGYKTQKESIELGPAEGKQIRIALTKIKARLWVETDPQDAAVRLVNLRTDFVQGMELEPGGYELEVSADGYKAKREKFELGAGEDRHHEVTLERATAHLWVDTEPQNATVEILNLKEKFTQGMELAPGNYHLEVAAPGYKPRREWLEVGAGEDKHFRVSLTKIETPPTELPESPPKTETLPEKEFTNTVGMKFGLIPAGTFQMGSPADEKDRIDDEVQHQVRLSRPFYLQTTPVTQGQWQQVMGNNPAYFQDGGDTCPVEQVSWDDAQEFLAKLNLIEKTDIYRLPTEAEWEYACRAGSTARFCCGDEEAKLPEYAWYAENSEGKTHPVGQKQPNAWGLYDLHGNVCEWCQDWYGEYPAGPVTDPEGPDDGAGRVLRGGSWYYGSRYLRSAERNYFNPDYRNLFVGFRVARTL